jgi:hypothetical protein
MIKSIFIRLAGDNDFINTIVPFVKAIGNIVLIEKQLLTKTQIVDLFNEHIYSFYVLYQNDGKEHLRIKPYLKITEKDVYLNEEITAFADSGYWNGDGCVVSIDWTPTGELHWNVL